MFERFGDLPLHVLVIHAAVVVLPVAAATAIVFALMPRWRWALRWPALGLAVIALGAAFVAKQSGEAFVAAVPQMAQLVQQHQDHGSLLLWVTLVFTAVVVLAALRLSGPSALASGRGAKPAGNRVVELAISAAVVVMAVFVIYQTVRTGDSGAKAVWDGRLPS
ncbi:DUF2231 domain-containing protein [Kribbella deserti]|uniref:DUF2231 domain-containing protein n=1 Tax=Kribbella deserti TaxID=1926257 RepID=A0ABV6QS37_9ACTN